MQTDLHKALKHAREVSLEFVARSVLIGSSYQPPEPTRWSEVTDKKAALETVYHYLRTETRHIILAIYQSEEETLFWALEGETPKVLGGMNTTYQVTFHTIHLGTERNAKRFRYARMEDGTVLAIVKLPGVTQKPKGNRQQEARKHRRTLVDKINAAYFLGHEVPPNWFPLVEKYTKKAGDALGELGKETPNPKFNPMWPYSGQHPLEIKDPILVKKNH